MKIAPATIISGPFTETKTVCYSLIQKILCQNKSCLTCVDCMMIHEQRHHNILWIQPEKKYTLDLLEPIFSKIEFSLQDNEHFFFIFAKADLLTQACANSLLKIVEEPPQNYHFIFLTTQAQNIISTIRSRCHTLYTTQSKNQNLIPFLHHFTKTPSLPAVFLKELQTNTIEDHEIPEALDQLLSYWIDLYKKDILSDDKNAHLTVMIIKLLEKNIESLPMPGSSKIFWRNLYISKDMLKKELFIHGAS